MHEVPVTDHDLQIAALRTRVIGLERENQRLKERMAQAFALLDAHDSAMRVMLDEIAKDRCHDLP